LTNAYQKKSLFSIKIKIKKLLINAYAEDQGSFDRFKKGDKTCSISVYPPDS